MSAGGLSYSGLTNYGKATLPSVDTWGTNMNILRDPPKSITTRRIDRVGQTSSITQMIDDSSNRACEAILQYARGVNPMVGVSYDNYGNNGGQRSRGITNQTQAYLPYTVIKDGAFRPPVLRQEQILPLSRQARPWTTAFTKPGFADFSRKMKVCGNAANTKEVKNSLMKVCARPSAVYKLETPLEEPFEIKYNIQNPLHVSGGSGVRTMDRTTQHVQEPTKGVDYNLLHASAQANKGLNKYVNNSEFDPHRYLQDAPLKSASANVGYNKHVDSSEFDPERYLQDAPHNPVSSNVAQPHLQVTSLEDIFDLSDNVKTKDKMNIYHNAPVSGYDKTEYIHGDLMLDRNLPEHNARTNIQQNIHKRSEYENELHFDRNMPNAQAMSNPGNSRRGVMDEMTSRDYRLKPTINAGGFDGRGVLPMQNRMQDVMAQRYESEKTKINRRVNEQFTGRYGSASPYVN